MATPVDAILGVVKTCIDVKKKIKQNKKRCERLLDNLEAIRPPLITIEKAETAMTHRETLSKLKRVVDQAEVLLRKQCTKSVVAEIFCVACAGMAPMAWQLTEINESLSSHMRAITLSVTVLASQKSGSIPAPAPAPAPAPVPVSPTEVIVDTGGDIGFLRLWRSKDPALAKLWPADADRRSGRALRSAATAW